MVYAHHNQVQIGDGGSYLTKNPEGLDPFTAFPLH